MVCNRCGTQLADVAKFCSNCGQPITAAQKVQGDPNKTTAIGAVAPDQTLGIIPYKNAPALVGYYLGVFSLIPCIGLPLGIAAVVLGILGLRKVKREPVVRGRVHAWVALALGALTTIVWVGLLLFLVTWNAWHRR